MADSVAITDRSRNLVTNSLLSTKLFIPQVRQLQDVLPRPRLVERLQHGLTRKLTLISAPAGYGKTMLLAEWIPQSDRRVCWLSLDETDNDLTRFLTYLIAALQQLKAGFGQALLATLQAPQPRAIEGLMTGLVNELIPLDDFALVLDDYHLLYQPDIHAAVAFLVNHLPPNMHLMITSRADPPLPLARLRVREQMTELRAADLRFTAEEATTFFHQIKNISLAAEQIQELDTRTEGWGAGLHLAALSLQGLDTADITRFIHDFTGSHHNVFDYLAEEVLQQQPAPLQRFLLYTSILGRLCGPLCDAILSGEAAQAGKGAAPSFQQVQTVPQNTGHSPASGWEVLAHLEHANLFLVPLDGRRHWYRYHHLFADFLRERLTHEIGLAAVNDLHRCASGWFEQQALAPEAVQHALTAGDGVLAARLIEPLARPMQLRGEMTTVMGWLTALPADDLRARPQLGLIYAWGLATTGQLLAAERWLQNVERALSISSDHSNLLGEMSVIRARITLIQGEYSRAVELARQALAYLPEDQLLLRALTHVSLGSACIGLGKLDTASESFAQASALYQASGQFIQALLPLRQLARAQSAQGRLNQLDQTTQEALQLAMKGEQRSPLVGYTYMSLGELCYERNDLAAVAHYFTDGLALVELGGTRDVLNLMNIVDAHLGLARLKQIQGDAQGALELLYRIEPIWEQLARTIQQRSGVARAAPSASQIESGSSQYGVSTLYADRIAAYRVRVWLSQGDIVAASQWVQSNGWNLEGEITFFQEYRLITLARVLIAQGKHERTLTLLARLLETTAAAGRMGQAIELLALQALALNALGREAEALNGLERALALAEPEGYIRAFVDEGPQMAALLNTAYTKGIRPAYVTTLLAAFSAGGWQHLEFESGDETSPNLKPKPVLDREDQTIQTPTPHSQNFGAPLNKREADKLLSTFVEPLSAREVEILTLMAQGLTNPEIAQQIYISAQTVKVHTRNIFGKLGVNDRKQAVAKARSLGLIP